MASSVFLVFALPIGLARTVVCSGVLGPSYVLPRHPILSSVIKWSLAIPFYLFTLVAWSAAISQRVTASASVPATAFGFWMLTVLAWSDIGVLALKLYRTAEVGMLRAPPPERSVVPATTIGGKSQPPALLRMLLDPRARADRDPDPDEEEAPPPSEVETEVPSIPEMRKEVLVCIGQTLPFSLRPRAQRALGNAWDAIANLDRPHLFSIVVAYVSFFLFLIVLLLGCGQVVPYWTPGRATADVATFGIMASCVAMLWDATRKWRLVDVQASVPVMCHQSKVHGGMIHILPALGIVLAVTLLQSAVAFMAFDSQVAALYAATAVWCPVVILPMFMHLPTMQTTVRKTSGRWPRYRRFLGLLTLIWPYWWEQKLLWEGAWWSLYFAFAAWMPLDLPPSTVPAAGTAYGATLAFCSLGLIVAVLTAVDVAVFVWGSLEG